VERGDKSRHLTSIVFTEAKQPKTNTGAREMFTGSASRSIGCALRIAAANESVNPIFTITDIIWHIWQYRG